MRKLAPLDRPQLCRFLAVRPRGLSSVLRDLGIRVIGGRVQFPVLWEAIGLDPAQPPEVWAELAAPLLTAAEIGAFCGVTPRTVYRWRHGGHEEGAHRTPMPAAIDLSRGREDARRLRWRRSEIRAWQFGQPIPVYKRKLPGFGALKPLP